jgi:hypothetical protein
VTLRQRRPRQRDPRHLDFIRQLPCLITGRRPVEAAHIRYADLPKGKPHTGMGEKPDDRWTVPLHPEMHRKQHAMGERRFWEEQGIDPCAVAQALYAVSGNVKEGLKVLRRARGMKGLVHGAL